MRPETAAALWGFRAGAERDAAARFAALSTALAATGASPVVVRMARAAAADERRHERMCASAARRFGGGPAAGSGGGLPGPPTLPRRRRVLHAVVATCCVTETVSAALLDAMRERTRDAELREVVRGILRDEVDHARLGWAHLAGGLDDGDRAWLSAALPGMLEDTVTDELFAEGDAGADLEPVGGLRRSVRRERLADALCSVVFPGLARFGVDPSAGEGWLARADA